jgi:hypothetical protein
MLAFLAALVPLISGFTQPLKDYFSFKQQVTQKEQEYKLAVLQSQIEITKSADIAASNDLKERLNSTSQNFKQNTFWFLCVPIVFTMIFPSKAGEMWHNFTLIPPMFQYIFQAVYCSIWGVPFIKNGYAGFTDLLQSRRDYKLEKARINRAETFKDLKNSGIFTGSQQEVELIDKVLDAGERNAQ